MTRRRVAGFVVGALLVAVGCARAQRAPAPMAERLLARLASHPRLLLDDARLGEVRAVVAADPAAAKAAAQVVADADAIRARGVVGAPTGDTYGYGAGLRERVLSLGVAWRLTGRSEYGDALRADALAACAGGWHADDGNFLGIGELSGAVAIAYDWLHARLDERDRATIRRALVHEALEPGLAAHAGHAWWTDTPINWNPVANGGLALAALAVAEDEPALARAVLARVIATVPIALATFEPDGAWPEGPGYGITTMQATALLCAGLASAVGDDAGLSERHGVRESGRFPILACGPTRLFTNFGDCGERRLRPGLPSLLWLARRFDRPEYARAELDYLATHAARALDLVWWPASPPPPATPPRDVRFRGDAELAIFRSAWDDRAALFAWLKGGRNGGNHQHLDLGSFELDALGERWVRDLGNDDYAVPGTHGYEDGGARWAIFRYASASHSVPLVDAANQRVDALAPIVAFADDAREPYAVVDLGAAYAPAARSARRGLRLVARRAVLVQDEIDLARAARVTIGITTDATIALAGDRAELSLGGQRLTARLLAPAGAVFSVASAERPPPEKRNEGVSRLLVDLPRDAGEVRVAVLLAPVWPDGEEPAPALRPLADWPMR